MDKKILIYLFMFVSLLYGVQGGIPIDPDACYAMEDTSQMTDYYGAYTAIYTNGVANSDWKINHGYDFESGDNTDMAILDKNITTTINENYNWTIALDINVEGYGESGNVFEFVNNSYISLIQYNTGAMRVYIEPSTILITIDNQTNINKNLSIVITYREDLNNLSVWVNGVFNTSRTVADINEAGNIRPNCIGNTATGTTNYDGKMDNFRVWRTYALTESEITSLFNGGQGQDCGWESSVATPPYATNYNVLNSYQNATSWNTGGQVGIRNETPYISITINENGNVSFITSRNDTFYQCSTTDTTNHVCVVPYSHRLLRDSVNYIMFNFTDGTDSNVTDNLSIYYDFSSYILYNGSLLNRTLDMIIRNEDIPTNTLNGTIEVDITYWRVNHTYDKNFSFEGGNNYNWSISLYPVDSIIQADVYIKYTTTNGFTHRYILKNTTLTNTTQTYYLYNFINDTGKSDLKITTRYESSYNYYPNVVTKLQRFYTGEGTWRTVQMDESGDYGLIFFNIKEETTDYRLIFYDTDNNILDTTQKMKFVCSSGLCDLTYLLSPYEASTTPTGLFFYWDYSSTTNIIHINWTDTLGGSNTITHLVTRETITGTDTICSSSQTGSAGVYNCNVTGYSGNVFLFSGVGDDSYISEWIELEASDLSSQLSTAEGALWTFGIMLICVMFGLFSPVGAIITTIVGLVMVFYIGIFSPLTVSLIIIAATMGIVIGLRVRT